MTIFPFYFSIRPTQIFFKTEEVTQLFVEKWIWVQLNRYFFFEIIFYPMNPSLHTKIIIFFASRPPKKNKENLIADLKTQTLQVDKQLTDGGGFYCTFI